MADRRGVEYRRLWCCSGLSPNLVAFALARVDSVFAGRAYAAYGGIYIAASLVWLWLAEGQRPNLIDLIGAGIAVSGALVITGFAPKGR